MKNFQKEELILRESGSGTRNSLKTLCFLKGKFKYKMVCNNSEAIKNAVMADMGISIISKMSVMKEIKENKLYTIPIEGIRFKRSFNIIYHKNKYITEAIREFWGICMV